jgi:hypothetical protein
MYGLFYECKFLTIEETNKIKRWPPQCSCIVIESSYDPGERLQAPGSLWFSFTLPKGM